MADDAESVRTWLVERRYSDRGLVTLVYATPDGDRALTRELSPAVLDRTAVTAARTVADERLSPVDDADTRERYRHEAARMADSHDPDDTV